MANKAYYAQAAALAHPGSFFVVPPGSAGADGRYQFAHPEGTGHAASPFESFWFVNLGRHCGDACALVAAALGPQRAATAPPARAVGTVEELRQRGLVPTAKRGNPKQRRKKIE